MPVLFVFDKFHLNWINNYKHELFLSQVLWGFLDLMDFQVQNGKAVIYPLFLTLSANYFLKIISHSKCTGTFIKTYAPGVPGNLVHQNFHMIIFKDVKVEH